VAEDAGGIGIKMQRRDFLKTIAGAALIPAVCLAGEDTEVDDTWVWPRNLILFGWDGADYSVVSDLFASGDLPHLAELTGGNAPHLMTIPGNTCTCPTWAEIFTGLGHDQTGVGGNKRYNPAVDVTAYDDCFRRYSDAMFWINQIPIKWSIQHWIRVNGFKTGMMTSKHGFLSPDFPQGPLADLIAACAPIVVHTPVFEGDSYLDAVIGRAVDFLRERHEGWFLFVHLNADFYGHKYGGRSEKYREEIRRCDAALGLILAERASNTRLIALSDHGFDPVDSCPLPRTGNIGTHKTAPHAFLATDLPLRDDAVLIPVNVAATILKYFSVLHNRRQASDLPRFRGKSFLRSTELV
jgi:hypothetical protein